MAKMAYEAIHAAICEDSLTECLDEGRGLCIKATQGLTSGGFTVLGTGYINALEKDSAWLGCLEAAGVDNWDGYDYARELRRNDEDD